MVQTMPSYICAMSEGDINILEEIFIDKYSEFISCYWLLKEFSDDISSINYERNKKDCLSIKFTLNTLDPEDIAHKLRNSNNDERVSISRKKEKISIKISKK